ncbi:PPE family protein [Lentzea albidocapillata subsp. violacea]|uniref:PPE family protein n=1 Tax=Lentzea albidocapillata subsp. violacea TaxID=128104 RepID=A0A1G9DRG3_9PSEU|nr:PPE domain-containing protein [Lentzea albidocapillata]SDK66426.1 PPE family protein [Lentzea albidocapillata subsp. violacea]
MSHGSHDNKGNGDKDDKSSHHGDGKYDRSDLHEPVDWMTYTHEQLYKMVHTGVNLDGAQAAATNWQKIGEDIAGVRTSLLKAVEDSSVGWDSESARLARDGLTEVTNWVDDTANYATKVSAAITTETSNVEAARAAMPPPPKAPEPPVPPETTVPRPALQERLRTVDQVDGFASLREPRLIAQPQTEFAGFATIGSSPVDALAANDASHRRAADVMAAFQRNSAAVDQTVPAQFTPPVNPINPAPVGGDLTGRTPATPSDGAGGGAGAPVTTGTQNQNRGTTNTSSRYGGGGAGGRGGAGGFGGFGGMARPFGSGSGNQGAAAASGAGGGASAGGSAGVSEGSRGGGAGGAAAAASAAPGNTTKAFQNPLAMGGAPMAGAPMAGGGQNDSKEHKTASYLEEDDNVFGLDRKAAPPVIGQ